MFSYKLKNAFLNRDQMHVSDRTFDRIIKATFEETQCKSSSNFESQLNLSDPQFFDSDIDIVRAKCAFGNWMIPKLQQELNDENPTAVRSAITILANELIRPEKMLQAIKLEILIRLSNFSTNDSYLKEQIAMIYKATAMQFAGRKVIVQNETMLNYLAGGLIDEVSAVRMKIAEAIEILAVHCTAAEGLCKKGFLELIAKRLLVEKENKILVILLKALSSLLNYNLNTEVVPNDIVKTLKSLLCKKEEQVLSATLHCLSVLCQETFGKRQSIELHLLPILNQFLYDDSPSVLKSCTSTLSFITILEAAKLEALKLQMIPRLVQLAANRHQSMLRICAMKTLNNLAETAEGKSILQDKYLYYIEECMIAEDDVERHKNILTKTIRGDS